jgi:hypothetical protein
MAPKFQNDSYNIDKVKPHALLAKGYIWTIYCIEFQWNFVQRKNKSIAEKKFMESKIAS